MKERYKSAPNFNQSQLGVIETDEETIIKSVVIIQIGEDKVGDVIDKDFLSGIVSQGNESDLGIKSRFGHPNMCATTLGTFIGRYKNFSIIEEDGKSKAIADLYLDEITKKTQVEGKGISMHEYITHMAKSNPDMFGNSIHFSGKQKTVKEGEDVIYTNTLILDKFFASDLVDTPAATDNLFKSSNDFGVIVTQFLDENPEIFKTVQDNPKVMDDFINRYTNYTKQKNKDMSLIDTIKKKLGVTKNIDLTLADGEMVTVITDAETPAVEDRITDTEGNPVADGEHVLPEGSAIVTVDSVITEIKDAPSEEEEEEEEEEAEEALSTEEVVALKSFAKSIPDFMESMKTLKEVPEALGLITDTQKSLGDKFTTLAKSVGTEFEPNTDENIEGAGKKNGKEPRVKYTSHTKKNK